MRIITILITTVLSVSGIAICAQGNPFTAMTAQPYATYCYELEKAVQKLKAVDLEFQEYEPARQFFEKGMDEFRWMNSGILRIYFFAKFHAQVSSIIAKSC